MKLDYRENVSYLVEFILIMSVTFRVLLLKWRIVIEFGFSYISFFFFVTLTTIEYEVWTLFDFGYCHVSYTANRRLQPSRVPLIPVVCTRGCLPSDFVTCQIKNDGFSTAASTNYSTQRSTSFSYTFLYSCRVNTVIIVAIMILQ